MTIQNKSVLNYIKLYSFIYSFFYKLNFLNKIRVNEAGEKNGTSMKNSFLLLKTLKLLKILSIRY